MRINKSKSIALTLAIGLIFAINPVGIATGDSTGNQSAQDGEIRRGYKASKYKKVTGYELVRFGFLGGEFTKIEKTYEYFPCCRPTFDDIDGCSAPEICPKYTS